MRAIISDSQLDGSFFVKQAAPPERDTTRKRWQEIAKFLSIRRIQLHRDFKTISTSIA
ncbi:MAG: hypothetical protein MK161_15575 [Pirellulales bacterium]|nr:hypothetical protein [Pirellulales bacterium]